MSAKWIEFVEGYASPSGKTRTWFVVPAGSPEELGRIKWFGRWRCYAFYPAAETVFERQCLRDIADFCEARTKEHRNKEQTT